MDIIKPNSAYPSLHDGLHIYSGSTTTYSTLLVIKTKLRQSFFVKFYRETGFGSTEVLPSIEQFQKELGYVESADAVTGGLNYTIKNISGSTIKYLIIGTHDIRNSTHEEITPGTGSLSNAQDITLDAIIEADGTMSFSKCNALTAPSLIFSSLGTGSFQILSDTPIFSTSKTVFSLCMENNNNTDGTFEIRGQVVDSTHFVITIFINDNEGSSIINLSNPPDRIMLMLKTYYS